MGPDEYRQFWAKKLESRAARLHRLVALNAPEFIIASERKLVFEALGRILVDPVAQQMRDNLSDSMRAEEEAFLKAHGFYDDRPKENEQ